MTITITVGTCRGRRAAAGYAGQVTRTVQARTLDAGMRKIARWLKAQGLRPIGRAIVEVRP